MMPRRIAGAAGLLLVIAAAASAAGGAAQGAQVPAPDARRAVAALDSQYQAAVKANDAAAMGRILADDMILVTGNGTVVTRAQLLASATDKIATYSQQDPSQRTVRLYGDRTAVVTALLWLKGTRSGQPFDYKLWYSDTYVLTPTGWRYAFGQASLRLPDPK